LSDNKRWQIILTNAEITHDELYCAIKYTNIYIWRERYFKLTNYIDYLHI
jgi:hypothetical protein